MIHPIVGPTIASSSCFSNNAPINRSISSQVLYCFNSLLVDYKHITHHIFIYKHRTRLLRLYLRPWPWSEPSLGRSVCLWVHNIFWTACSSGFRGRGCVVCPSWLCPCRTRYSPNGCTGSLLSIRKRNTRRYVVRYILRKISFPTDDLRFLWTACRLFACFAWTDLSRDGPCSTSVNPTVGCNVPSTKDSCWSRGFRNTNWGEKRNDYLFRGFRTNANARAHYAHSAVTSDVHVGVWGINGQR